MKYMLKEYIQNKRLTGMNVGMLLHVTFLVKPLPAEPARIRPGIAVDQQVRRQRARSLERLPALLTFEYFLYTMHSSVK